MREPGDDHEPTPAQLSWDSQLEDAETEFESCDDEQETDAVEPSAFLDSQLEDTDTETDAVEFTAILAFDPEAGESQGPDRGRDLDDVDQVEPLQGESPDLATLSRIPIQLRLDAFVEQQQAAVLHEVFCVPLFHSQPMPPRMLVTPRFLSDRIHETLQEQRDYWGIVLFMRGLIEQRWLSRENEYCGEMLAQVFYGSIFTDVEASTSGTCLEDCEL